MKKWRINWNKRKSYILPILFMVLIIGLTWLLFFHYDIINDKEQKITVIIGFLAINFGLFQFWINEINIEKREKFNLRYSSYQELITLMETLVEIVNTQMFKKTENEIDYHSLTSAILNQVNKINSLININDKYLFPGIQHLNETRQILDILEKILINTDKLRIESEKELQKTKPDMREFRKSILKINWHNDMRQFLMELHENKYSFYSLVRAYL